MAAYSALAEGDVEQAEVHARDRVKDDQLFRPQVVAGVALGEILLREEGIQDWAVQEKELPRHEILDEIARGGDPDVGQSSAGYETEDFAV